MTQLLAPPSVMKHSVLAAKAGVAAPPSTIKATVPPAASLLAFRMKESVIIALPIFDYQAIHYSVIKPRKYRTEIFLQV
ncbi:hypothetical protein GCM10010124_41330 [Pilimelia terevasa]|uniref:Uncharacterized protein n=1 Tax=Pilimelia terevasa TaxID=53372 RepID=A0A8J3BQW2_9ACTN|nr:hypothetical protein GCM10010124_41330 [Pilimelia terevasa]